MLCLLAAVRRLPSARKRLAVPFRAAQTPAERSEYSHPDVALAKTTLSYYGDGLTMQQFTEALTALLRMGPSAQETNYGAWFQLSKDQLSPGVDC